MPAEPNNNESIINVELQHAQIGTLVHFFAVAKGGISIEVLGAERVFMLAIDSMIFDRCKSKCLEVGAIMLNAVVMKTMEIRKLPVTRHEFIKSGNISFRLPSDDPRTSVKQSAN